MIKKGCIILFLFILLIPTISAMDNDTIQLEESNNMEVLESSTDYYFNASVIDDGDGSIQTPYKNLENNIKANSVNHLSNGEYDLGENVIINDVSFIGQDAEKTVINCHGEVLNNTKNLFLKNVTLIDFTIINKGTLTCENSILSDGYGFSQDKYGNSWGGAIYSPYHESKKFKVTITNCTFKNNYAEYGGAIYMDGGELNIVDSQFINNLAYNYGGAIACEYNTKLSINRTKFVNSKSINDAGGAIYIKEVNFDSNRVDIINSTSTFGGAITALNSNITISRLNAYNNSVKYDGGAIYHLYGKCSIQQCKFINNTARNGAGVFLNNLTSMLIISNQFENNNASLCGGAIYSIANPKLTFQNIYKNNHALVNKDLYETASFNVSDIGNGNYTIYINDDTFDGAIPEYYNLNEHGYVSSIKNQLYGGNCWAFSALAALESCILKASGKELDLSEENMKNLMELYSDFGWQMDTNQGGYNNMAIGYLTSWLGPIDEINDTYDDFSTLSPLLDSLMHIQNVLFLKRDNYTDNDAIKMAILKYGAVSTGICYYSEYLKGNSYYCYKIFDYPNHAVSIVGWNDTYSKDNFWGNPEVDGAWIVKNSWGESWGDGGYFYVSYCDRKLAQVGTSESAYTFILNDSRRYDNNYQYDIIGKTGYFSSNEDQIYYQNIFKATNNEILTAVSTYFEKLTNWDLSIYVNDILKLTQNGVNDAGYYTIRLNELIPLSIGDSFKIIFKISGNGTFRIPISEKSYTNKFLSKEGLSFFSYDGSTWFDLYTSSTPSVASIKAFTLLNKVNTNITLNITDNQINPVEIIATIVDEYGNLVKSGNVTFKIENKDYWAIVEKGTCKFYHNFTSGGLKNISVVFNGEIYKESYSSALINVNISKTSLIVNNIVSYFGNLVKYSIKLVDENDTAISGKMISVKINGKNYQNMTDDNGTALIYIKLAIGEYTVNVNFSGDNKYIKSNRNSKITVKTTVSPQNQNKFTYNAKFSIKLLDVNGNPLKNRVVNVLINSKNHKVTTNNNGEAVITITQNPGKYTVKITNPVNNEVKMKNIQVLPRITENKNINMYVGAKKSFKVHIFNDNGNSAKAGQIVKFKIGSKSYSRTTDKKGYASLSISQSIGKYTIIAMYKGFKVSNKLVIKSTLTAKDKSIKKGKKLKFTAKLVDVNGKAAKGKKINFKIKNKKYTAKTNKKGIATIKIKNLKKGKYTITSSYGKVKINNKIIVK